MGILAPVAQSTPIAVVAGTVVAEVTRRGAAGAPVGIAADGVEVGVTGDVGAQVAPGARWSGGSRRGAR